MKAEILCVGTELLLGNIVNTNAVYLAKELAKLGINVYHQAVVGDNPERLKASLKEALSRCDLVITTGGLGPTCDDLTKETAAEVLKLPMEENAEELHHIKEYFQKINRTMTDNNRKQALIPNPQQSSEGCAEDSFRHHCKVPRGGRVCKSGCGFH